MQLAEGVKAEQKKKLRARALKEVRATLPMLAWSGV